MASEHPNHVENRRDPNSNEQYQVYRGMHFQNGFLFKRFTIRNLEVKNVTPALPELEDFLKGETDEHMKQQLIDETTK